MGIVRRDGADEETSQLRLDDQGADLPLRYFSQKRTGDTYISGKGEIRRRTSHYEVHSVTQVIIHRTRVFRTARWQDSETGW